MRDIFVKFTIKWDDYDDVCDELILEDLELTLKNGVELELLEQPVVSNMERIQITNNFNTDKGSKMKTYIGTKIVKAKPMDEFTFKRTVKKVDPSSTEENAFGYVVEYEDGYQSWSPKATFERAYREITEEEKKLIV